MSSTPFQFIHNQIHDKTDHMISVSRKESSGLLRVYYQKVEYPQTPIPITSYYSNEKSEHDTLLVQKRIMGDAVYEIHTLFQYPNSEGKRCNYCCINCEPSSFMKKWNQYETAYSLEKELPQLYPSNNNIQSCIPNASSISQTQLPCPSLSKKELDHIKSLCIKKEPVVKQEPKSKEMSLIDEFLIHISEPESTEPIIIIDDSLTKKTPKFVESFWYEDMKKKKKKHKLYWKPCELRFDIDGCCYSLVEFKKEYKETWFSRWNESIVAFSCKNDTYKKSQCYFNEELEDDDYQKILSSLKRYRKYLLKESKVVTKNYPSIILLDD